VHGITDVMVAGAPEPASVARSLREWCAARPLVFHNAPFDLSFLRAEARLAGGAWPGNPVLDTLVLARRTGRFRSHSLPNICRELGIGEAFHRAEADAWAAGKLLLHLTDKRGRS
jgi:DNA polymerase III epsilon subunit-like protein